MGGGDTPSPTPGIYLRLKSDNLYYVVDENGRAAYTIFNGKKYMTTNSPGVALGPSTVDPGWGDMDGPLNEPSSSSPNTFVYQEWTFTWGLPGWTVNPALQVL